MQARNRRRQQHLEERQHLELEQQQRRRQIRGNEESSASAHFDECPKTSSRSTFPITDSTGSRSSDNDLGPGPLVRPFSSNNSCRDYASNKSSSNGTPLVTSEINQQVPSSAISISPDGMADVTCSNLLPITRQKKQKHQQHQQNHTTLHSQSRTLSVSPYLADLMRTTEYSDENQQENYACRYLHSHQVTDSSADNRDEIHSVSSSSSALSMHSVTMPQTRYRSQGVDELKIRLAETATQLTTAEDELRQKIEVEASLRFAVDILKKQLNIRRMKIKGRTEEEEDDEMKTVHSLLSDLGLQGPPSQQASTIARNIEESELRTEALRARLVTSEERRGAAERKLLERNAQHAELQAEIEVVRNKLRITQKKADKEKANLERKCSILENSKKHLKQELERLFSDTRPEDPRKQRAALASAEEREAIEARAKAKVLLSPLLSLQEDADLFYNRAVEDVEATIQKVYANELKTEIEAVADLSNSFKLLQTTHEKIKAQCDAVLAIKDANNEIEAGKKMGR